MTRAQRRDGGLLCAAAILLLPVGGAQGHICTDLRKLRQPGVTIIEARAFPAGPFSAPTLHGRPQPALARNALCRVRAVASPVPGSRIGMEVWLPAAGRWDGRFRMYGNGGYSSDMPFVRLVSGLNAGSVVAATDTGHTGDDPDFVVGHPEALTDWSHRAVHETAVAAKALARSFYGKKPRFSYFEGCSTGGQQALSEAQRYPLDFNGISAGAPGNNRIRLNVAFLWQFVSNRNPADPGRPLIAPAQLRGVTREVLRQCGTAAEQARGYLDNPFACRFDAAAMLCGPDRRADCLDAGQVTALRAMTGGARNPRTGAQIYPPWLPGSESIGPTDAALPGWSLYWSDPAHPQQPARAGFFRSWALRDPAWDWRSFDFDADVMRIEASLGASVAATSPDLSAFRDAGGRLVVWHGLMDPVVSPWDSLFYRQSVADRMAAGMPERLDDFYRLFFAPGMGHCGEGPGINAVDTGDALIDWVEQRRAPII